MARRQTRTASERITGFAAGPIGLPKFGDHARRHGVSCIAGPDGSIGAGKGEGACQAHGVTLARSGPGLFHH
ncbi:hypothetical protein ACNPQM_11950 [Streptomyces sp. NPDC056231]|uniref:hypothetical protein n=1 Tax=Streptomyces sp. NPDC056231 TaxID=3345755 RepID=UPI003AAC6A5D